MVIKISNYQNSSYLDVLNSQNDSKIVVPIYWYRKYPKILTKLILRSNAESKLF